MFQKRTISFPHSNPEKKVDRKGKIYYIEQGADAKIYKNWNRWLDYCEKHNLTRNGNKKVVTA